MAGRHVKSSVSCHGAVRRHAWSAGVTVGLMAGEGGEGMEQWELLADTSSLEEDLGPMQLHAAGSAGGFTALQLVCNRPGIPPHSPGDLPCAYYWAEIQSSLLEPVRRPSNREASVVLGNRIG